MSDDREHRLRSRLPTEARERLGKLLRERDSLLASARDAIQRSNELRAEIAHQKLYVDQRVRIEALDVHDGGIRVAREAIKFRSQELGDLDTANAERQSRLSYLTTITQRALAAISAVPLTKLLQAAGYERPPSVRGNHADAVEKVRARIRVMKGARDEISRAPLPVAMLKETAREQIEALAARGRPDLTGLAADGSSIGWPKSSEMAGGTPEDVAIAVLAYAHGPALIAAVHAQIDREASDEGAMTPADRAAALKKIDGEIEAAERSEVALIDDAAEHGVTIDFRSDGDVFAILKLSRQFVDAPKTAAAPRLGAINARPENNFAGASLTMPKPALRSDTI